MIIGTGVDIVEIERFRKVVERLKDRFLLRVFTQGEREFCGIHRSSVPHFAVRFAAKEAVFKALGTGWAKGVTWLDVEVIRERQDPPRISLSGEALRLGQQRGVRNLHLSLSHTELSAIAMVVLEG
jgi:holo-[acyl-carrier protein] synthase